MKFTGSISRRRVGARRACQPETGTTGRQPHVSGALLPNSSIRSVTAFSISSFAPISSLAATRRGAGALFRPGRNPDALWACRLAGLGGGGSLCGPMCLGSAFPPKSGGCARMGDDGCGRGGNKQAGGAKRHAMRRCGIGPYPVARNCLPEFLGKPTESAKAGPSRPMCCFYRLPVRFGKHAFSGAANSRTMPPVADINHLVH